MKLPIDLLAENIFPCQIVRIMYKVRNKGKLKTNTRFFFFIQHPVNDLIIHHVGN